LYEYEFFKTYFDRGLVLHAVRRDRKIWCILFTVVRYGMKMKP